MVPKKVLQQTLQIKPHLQSQVIFQAMSKPQNYQLKTSISAIKKSIHNKIKYIQKHYTLDFRI